MSYVAHALLVILGAAATGLSMSLLWLYLLARCGLWR